ncbi:acetyl xylan esterase [Enterobacter hormaechei subsp. xiangfangensis]|nr:acetyl xylan esterase [Enterobacter hormaechei subsp. xiangfangensis]
MQVQDQLQGAPVLVLAGDPVSLKRMQNHAPYACMAFICKNGGIVGDF